MAGAFARQVVAGCGPLPTAGRAKNLLWAAVMLAGWSTGAGLEPVPGVLLHPSVIERFTAHAPGISGASRRTLRANLRFIARRVVPHQDTADAPLPPRAGQGSIFCGGDRRDPGAGRCPAEAGPASQGGRAGVPGRGGGADPLRPAQRLGDLSAAFHEMEDFSGHAGESLDSPAGCQCWRPTLGSFLLGAGRLSEELTES